MFSFLLEGDLRTEDYCLLIYLFAFDEISFIPLFNSCNVLPWDVQWVHVRQVECVMVNLFAIVINTYHEHLSTYVASYLHFCEKTIIYDNLYVIGWICNFVWYFSSFLLLTSILAFWLKFNQSL